MSAEVCWLNEDCIAGPHTHRVECRFPSWQYEANECHCGEPITYGFDGDPTHHRGMCEHCDSVRCDAYPGECGR